MGVIEDFDKRDVDSKHGVIVWREIDQETPEKFKEWLESRRDGLKWTHPDYEE